MIRKRLRLPPLPPAPTPQEHHDNVEFMAEALRVGFPRGRPAILIAASKKKTVFDCIGPDGRISDAGWELLDLDNPHTRYH